jgi:hypothetical protein
LIIPYQWWKGVPAPEGDEEANPREKEHTAIHVYEIEDRYRPGLVVDRVDRRGLEQD